MLWVKSSTALQPRDARRKPKGKSIADQFFKTVPPIRDKMAMLEEVGLGCIKVGQQATTLSGGEAA